MGSSDKDVLAKTETPPLRPKNTCPASSVWKQPPAPPPVHGRPDRIASKNVQRKIYCNPDAHGHGGGRGVCLQYRLPKLFIFFTFVDVRLMSDRPTI